MNYGQRLTDSTLAIFLFHGVVEKSDYQIRNYTRKHLEKDFFYAVVKHLRQTGYPMSMEDVVACHHEREPFPPRSFVMTFDDGFENNYSIAAPILKDFQIPATFYLTTDFVENNTMSWIDRIEYCLEATPKGTLRLPWYERPRDFASEQERKDILDDIRASAKRNANLEVDTLVSDIFQQCGLTEIYQSDQPIDLKMSWPQAKTLHEDPDFTVGGHTHRHVILSFLSSAELEKEVRTSFAYLDKKAGIQTVHYSYPEGLEHCYSDEVIRVLQKHGVVCCPTAMDGTNSHRDNLFHLKRIFVT
ncbi:MAG: polysaccharide deacetylase family protein [bacterium]